MHFQTSINKLAHLFGKTSEINAKIKNLFRTLDLELG